MGSQKPLTYIPAGGKQSVTTDRPGVLPEVEVVWLDRQLNVRGATSGAASFFEWEDSPGAAASSNALRARFEDPGLESDLRAVLAGEHPRAKAFVEQAGQRLGRVVAPYGHDASVDGVAVVLTRINEDPRLVARGSDERSILNATSDAVLTVTADGIIQDFNLAAQRLVDASLAEMQGRHISSLLPAFEALLPMPALLERSRRYQGIESTVRGQDGREIPVHVVVSELEWSSSFILSIRDFTAIRNAQQRALQRGRLAAVGETMTALAHESRNALQRMQSCLTLLELRAGPETQGLLEDMQEAQDQLQRLYEEVRQFAAPMQLRLRETDLAGLLRRVWRELKVEWEPKRLILRLENGSNGVRARLDARRVAQVLRNVLENAIYFSPVGGVIEARLREETLNEKPAARIEIVDQGPGISEQDAARAFDLLFTSRDGGTGMGLSIARRIIDDHRGVIEIAPAMPGTRVVIALPGDDEIMSEGMA